jgi:hypothetical protein
MLPVKLASLHRQGRIGTYAAPSACLQLYWPLRTTVEAPSCRQLREEATCPSAIHSNTTLMWRRGAVQLTPAHTPGDIVGKGEHNGRPHKRLYEYQSEKIFSAQLCRPLGPRAIHLHTDADSPQRMVIRVPSADSGL